MFICPCNRISVNRASTKNTYSHQEQIKLLHYFLVLNYFLLHFLPMFFAHGTNIETLWLHPNMFLQYIYQIVRINVTSKLTTNAWRVYNKWLYVIKTSLTYMLNWINIELKMEGSKCCSQLGWSMQKLICKILIKPFKTSWKEVPMDIQIALSSWNTCFVKRFTYLKSFISA